MYQKFKEYQAIIEGVNQKKVLIFIQGKYPECRV